MMNKQVKRLKVFIALTVVVLSFIAPSAAFALSSGQTLYVNTPSGDVLYMRSAPSTSGRILTQLPTNQSVTYLGKSGSWYKVKWAGYTGYMFGKYLSTTKTVKGGSSGGSSGGSIKLGYHWVSHPYGQNVNLRQKAGYEEKIICKVPDGSSIKVIQTKLYWSLVEYYSFTGWMSNDYIK